MGKFMNRIFALAAGIALVVNVSGCATYKVHPEFKERHKNFKSVALMTPQVEAYMLTFQGDKKVLKDLIPVMEKTTTEQFEKIFAEKGYIIKKVDLSEEAMTENPDLRTAYFHANELFKKQLGDIAKNKKSKFTYELGSDVNTFANRADCDILIFVKEDGIKKSAGEIAKDVAKGLAISAACLLVGAIYIPVPQAAATVVHIAIVDGNDGAVLWYNNNVAAANYDPENQKQLAALIKSLISPFPDQIHKKEKSKTVPAAQKDVAVGEQIQAPKDITPPPVVAAGH